MSKTKKSFDRILALLLSVMMVLAMIPVSTLTAFAATAEHPDSFTVSVKDTQGNPIEGANVQFVNGDLEWSIYLTAQTDANGIAVFDSNEIKAAFEAGVAAGTITSEFVLGNVSAIKSGYKPESNELVRFYADAGYTEHVEFTMTPPITDVEIAGKNIAYNGEAQELVSVTAKPGDTVEYSVDGDAATTTVPTATDVCSKSIVVTVKRDGYVTLSKTVIGKIIPADITDVTIEAANNTYNGSEIPLVSISGTQAEDTVTYKVNDGEETAELPKATNAGSYQVKVVVDRGANYNKFEKTVTSKIELAELELGEIKVQGLEGVYTGEAQDAVSVTGKGDYSLQYKLGDGEWSDTIPTVTDAGSYTVSVKATKTNYNDKDVAVDKAESAVYPFNVYIAKADQTGFAFASKTLSPLAYKGTLENKATGGQTDGTITYEVVAGAEYVSVDQNGKITVLKAGGNATIKATRAGNSNYNAVSDTYSISTIKADQSDFAFEQTEYTVQYGTDKLTVVAKGGQSNGAVTYEVLNGDIGTIASADNKGNITFVSGKKGEMTIKATLAGGENYNDISAEVTVKVLTNDFSDKVSVDTCPTTGWYTETVSITPAAGYKISTSAQFDAEWKDSITVATEGKNSPDDVFLLEEATGYISEAIAIEDIYIDKTNPTALNITYSNSIRDVILETISFGFYDAEMEVTLTATDLVSKVDHFVYKIGNGAEVTINKADITFSGTDGEVATASFNIPANLSRSKITLTAFDTTGRSNTIVGDKTLVVDNVKPVVSVSYDNNEADHSSYFQGSRTATITIAEENFFKDNLYDIIPGTDKQYLTITVGKRGDNDNNYTETVVKPVFTKDGDVYKATYTFTDDADYTFDVVFFDYSLNENAPVDYGTSVAPTAFTIDNTDPVVEISYDDTNAVESATNAGYFTGSRKLIIKVTEHNFNAAELDFTEFIGMNVVGADVEVSEIAAIITYFKTPASWAREGNISTATYTFDDEGTDANYAIEINYDDLAGNAAAKETSAFCLDNTKPYVVADDEISYSASILDTILNAITFGFYKAEMEVTITAYDETAGIDFFTYSYTLGDDKHQGYDGKSNIIIPNNDITFTEGGKKATAKFKIPEQFCGYVSFTATDKSGNTSEQFTDVKRIAVDNVKPTVDVEWENKDALKTIGNRKYFDGSRTAILTIVDKHFIESGFEPIIEAKDSAGLDVAVEPQYNWTHDGDTHVLKITFSDDANYTFNYICKDLASNQALEYTTDEFTIDNNKPYNLKVDYVGDEKQTAGYYDDKVTVTISADDATSGITQFIYSYVKAEGVSDVNAGMTNVLIIENIRQNGKTFSADFEIPKEALDKNNQFNGYVEFEAIDIVEKVESHKETANIVVDNIPPVVDVTYSQPITEANNIKYYAGNIDAKVVITEANFNSDDVVVKVNDNKVTDVSWNKDNADTNTGTFTITGDGDYIVTVEYTDRSENKMETYTSNRLTIDTKAPVVSVSNIKNNSANKEEKFGFTITAKDINLDSTTFKPTLTAVVLNENGTFSTKTISLGDMATVKVGEEYSFTIDNLADDAIYTLICTVEDMSDNKYENVVLSDGKEYESVCFSVNRNGSTYGIEENTADLIEKYYVQNVTDNVVIVETNADPLTEYKVTLNGKELTEDTDYTVTEEGGNGSWMKYTYSVNKGLFANEGEYKIVVSSKDKATNNAFSDVKDATVNFVVDRTAPIVTITGLANDGRYQTDVQTVTLIPTDDGGALKSLIVRTVDEDGKQLKEILNLVGEELEKALEDGAGKITFKIEKGLYQNVQIICNDCAVDEEGKTNVYDETIKNVSVDANAFIVNFWANKPLRWGSIVGVILIAAVIIFLVIFKKRKQER